MIRSLLKPGYLIVKVIIVLVLSSFIVTRHDKPDADYITLGKKYPMVGKVGERAGDCSLIAPDWVITAAHVAAGMQERFGNDFNIFMDGKAYKVASIFIHPEFKPMDSNDIALIKLQTSVAGITPSLLYRKNDEVGKEITIVGHGDNKTGKETTWKMDGKRRAATNRIDEANQAHIIFKFDPTDSPFTTELEGTAGRGDSGGPAFIQQGEKLYVAGISSAGMPGVNGPGTYGAIEHYTRVSKHLAWIDRVMSGKEKEVPKRVGGMQQGPPPVFPGLGLFLIQQPNQIAIDGKIDPEVPKEFRDAIFAPPSHIVSLNGKNYKLLEEFKKDFNAIKKGTSYEIVFSLRGQQKTFKTIR